MSLTLCLFRLKGQSRIIERRLVQTRGQTIAGLCASFPSPKEREHLQLGLRRAPDAKLQSVAIEKRYFEGTVGFTRSVRVFGGQTVNVPTQYQVWLRKNSSIVAVAGSSMVLAEAFAKAFQWGATGGTHALDEIAFPKAFLSRLGHWLTSGAHSRPGAILRARFINASLDGEKPFDEITLASQTLLSSKTYKALSSGDAQPAFVTFMSPLFEGVSRQLACSLAFRGLLRITTTEVTPNEANRLLDEFEALVAD
jgi:hypothetical protein